MDDVVDRQRVACIVAGSHCERHGCGVGPCLRGSAGTLHGCASDSGSSIPDTHPSTALRLLNRECGLLSVINLLKVRRIGGLFGEKDAELDVGAGKVLNRGIAAHKQGAVDDLLFQSGIEGPPIPGHWQLVLRRCPG